VQGGCAILLQGLASSLGSEGGLPGDGDGAAAAALNNADLSARCASSATCVGKPGLWRRTFRWKSDILFVSLTSVWHMVAQVFWPVSFLSANRGNCRLCSQQGWLGARQALSGPSVYEVCCSLAMPLVMLGGICKPPTAPNSTLAHIGG